MSYDIHLKELWSKSDLNGNLQSKWTWTVYLEGVQIDAGSVPFGGEVGEREARKNAERAARLDHKRQTARVESYEFDPS